LLLAVTVVKVRLTKKLALRMDGVDVSAHRVGDILELSPEKARVLVAEDWATTEERRRHHLANPPVERRRHRVDDNPPRQRR
jgi:hypothetical protein